MDNKRIIIVDDDPMMLKSLARLLKKAHYSVEAFVDPREAENAVSQYYYDIMITDYSMPYLTGIELIRRFKRRHENSEAILVTGLTEFGLAVSAVNEGNVFKFITKPFEANRLINYVEDAYQQVEKNSIYRHFKDWSFETLGNNDYDDVVVALQRNAIDGLMNLMKAKDEELYEHSQRIGKLCLLFANEIGYPINDVDNLYHAALLHDIGKLAIKDQILDKQSGLNALEFNEIKRHPSVGADLVKKLGVNHVIQDYIRQHHERIDGKGYPLGLSGDEIAQAAKIIAVADAYDALSSKRAYKAALDFKEVQRILIEMSVGTFDRVLVDAFLEMLTRKHLRIV
ncbi:response regulator [Fusibacter paucivorans]|uniref:Stage 0 sporulation protein A homolog n=1 Tax=Fusibacter paucivorans TaxID=76009 RepID=A0ABS5PPE9_9FIRM|nr:HD domain-containing phosphohydrolase [Fusibacter paucivorans]MBS7527055.1 response regulator [Fusibacter paucivorans]